MSQYYDGECNSFSREVTPVARKPHKCEACHEVIPVGAKYSRLGLGWEGSVSTIKRCLRCVTIYNHLESRCGNSTLPDLWLNCGHTYEEIHGEAPPPEIAALAFTLPGEVHV